MDEEDGWLNEKSTLVSSSEVGDTLAAVQVSKTLLLVVVPVIKKKKKCCVVLFGRVCLRNTICSSLRSKSTEGELLRSKQVATNLLMR